MTSQVEALGSELAVGLGDLRNRGCGQSATTNNSDSACVRSYCSELEAGLTRGRPQGGQGPPSGCKQVQGGALFSGAVCLATWAGVEWTAGSGRCTRLAVQVHICFLCSLTVVLLLPVF